MESFEIIVNGFQPLTIITKRFILDVAAVLDPPLTTMLSKRIIYQFSKRKTQRLYVDQNKKCYHLRYDCQLNASLYVACQTRESDLFASYISQPR